MKRFSLMIAVATAIVAGKSAWADPDPSLAPADWALIRLYDDVRTGYRITPVPVNAAGRSWTLVGLGSYLVNAAGGCNDCHTQPSYQIGGDPFLGQPKKVNSAKYLAGGQPFGPGLISANITPDSSGKPAGLTLARFQHVLRTGENPDHPGRLLQVMPWPTYQSLSDTDIRAIYTYLQSIPSRPNNF